MEKIKRLLLVLAFCCGAITASKFKLGDKLFFLQNRDPDSGQEEIRLVVVTWSSEADDQKVESCEVFTDQKLIDEVLKSSKDPPIKEITEEDMQGLLEDCTEVTRRRRRRDSSDPDLDSRDSRSQFDSGPPNLLDRAKLNRKPPKNEEEETTTLTNDIEEGPAQSTTEGYNGWPVIWPGTKWCGAGDIAKDYNDLGLHADTDKCCRAHDLCNDTLAPGETRNDLKNKSPFTTLSCKCDRDFYNCLDHVDSVPSNTIGNLYFNVLKRKCYSEDYPFTKKCKKYRTFLKITCKEYEKDTSAPKVYQWESAKFYKKIPFPGPLTITLPF